jgi:hypothetical protein
MMRWSVTLALVLVGCRAPAPPVAQTPDRPPQPIPPQPMPAQPDPQVDVATVTPEPEPVALVNEGGPTAPGVPPPGVSAAESACEQSCGEVHDCALIDGTYTPAAAAAIELGCVDACLRTPERATLFGCGRPTVIEPGTCSPFLACVGAAWPTGGGVESPSEVVVDRPGGCARTCEVFARCWDSSMTPDRIAQCAEQCRQALDETEEAKFGLCSELPDCADVMICVNQTPGA